MIVGLLVIAATINENLYENEQKISRIAIHPIETPEKKMFSLENPTVNDDENDEIKMNKINANNNILNECTFEMHPISNDIETVTSTTNPSSNISSSTIPSLTNSNLLIERNQHNLMTHATNPTYYQRVPSQIKFTNGANDKTYGIKMNNNNNEDDNNRGRESIDTKNSNETINDNAQSFGEFMFYFEHSINRRWSDKK